MMPWASIRINRPAVGCDVAMTHPTRADAGSGRTVRRTEGPGPPRTIPTGTASHSVKQPEEITCSGTELPVNDQQSAARHGNWRLSIPVFRACARPGGLAVPAVGRDLRGFTPTRIRWAESGQDALPCGRGTDAVEGDPLEVSLRMSGIVDNGSRNRNQYRGLHASSSSKSKWTSLRCQAFLPCPHPSPWTVRRFGVLAPSPAKGRGRRIEPRMLLPSGIPYTRQDLRGTPSLPR